MKNKMVFHMLLIILGMINIETEAQEIPRPEHPRPQFQRENWINLNGRWNFMFDHGNSGKNKQWHINPSTFNKKIMVPFCPESKLSGIEYKDFMPAIWYHKNITLPESWEDKQIFLHFGAVDYESHVWVNGIDVGEHHGGNTSFELDITNALKKGENSIVVLARDDIRSKIQASGKQSITYHNQGCCRYTRVSGIWQTVWLEARASHHIKKVNIVPDIDQSQLVFIPEFSEYKQNQEFIIKIMNENGNELTTIRSNAPSGIPVPVTIDNPVLWSTENPYLYSIEYQLINNDTMVDVVSSYAGLRKIHISGNKIFLNNKPLFLRFVLDQGFYPDGIWTAPDDQALKKDIELSLAAGFNGARLHQKVFEERYHYWADKLGYLTWAEFADWGMDLSDETAYSFFLNEWIEAVDRDKNHPSIICWTPLNERWPDQFYKYRYRVKKIYEITKSIDPVRPVNDASGWFHIITDIYTVHDYEIRTEVFKKRYGSVSVENPEEVFICPDDWNKHKQAPYTGQPYVLDEYGGIYWQQHFAQKERPDSKDALIRLWGYQKSKEQVLQRIKKLTEVLLKNPSISGFTYTQLTDVEQELNGIFTYDREPKYPVDELKKIFGAKAAIE